MKTYLVTLALIGSISCYGSKGRTEPQDELESVHGNNAVKAEVDVPNNPSSMISGAYTCTRTNKVFLEKTLCQDHCEGGCKPTNLPDLAATSSNITKS